jgi:hypothetical protein
MQLYESIRRRKTVTKVRINKQKLMVLCGIVAVTLAQSLSTSTAINAPRTGGLNEPDLSSEDRALEAYIQDLGNFEKKVAQFERKGDLSRNEFVQLEGTAEGLKGRLASVQNAVRSVVVKLKSTGNWDDLDAKLLPKISDSRLQAHFRQNSFKQALEKAAADLNNQANEISSPLDSLRKKISAQLQGPDSRNDSELILVRIAYSAKPAMTKVTSLRCRLSNIRLGISGFVHSDGPTGSASRANICACYSADEAADMGVTCN